MEYEIRNEKYIILARVSRKISTVDGRGNYGIRCGKREFSTYDWR
jgi:hypothetical protein